MYNDGIEFVSFGRKEIRNNKEIISKKSFITRFKKLLPNFILGGLIGAMLTSILFAFAPKKDDEILFTYGVLSGENSVDESFNKWLSQAEYNFKPLNVPLSLELQQFVYFLAHSYNIDFKFVMAIIEQESYFDANIISETNDFGLMQINEINHLWLSEKFGFTDFLDPYQNTHSGIYILRNLFAKYEDVNRVLMVYNLGESGAKKLWSKGVFETDYTRKVTKKILGYEVN